MMSNETGKDIGTAGKPLEESAPKATQPSETQRELTDDEIASVAGGLAAVRPGGSGPKTSTIQPY
jgi:hypothetical protein